MSTEKSTQKSKELLLLERLKWFKSELSAEFVGKSKSRTEKHLRSLRIDTMHQFAEFFYLIDVAGLTDMEKFEAFVSRHNDYMLDLANNSEKRNRLGLDQPRVEAALLDGNTIPRLLEQWRSLRAFEQSNLARFLSPVMSPETTRQMVVTCEAAGFLTRQKTFYGSFVVRSNGVMEDVYSRCLRGLIDKLSTFGFRPS